MSENPRKRTGEAHRTFGEEGGLVVRPTRSEIKVLNAVGSTVYALLDGSHSRDEIARRVADEYDVSFEQARCDVEEYLAQLDAEGMLDSSSTSEPHRPDAAGEKR